MENFIGRKRVRTNDDIWFLMIKVEINYRNQRMLSVSHIFQHY